MVDNLDARILAEVMPIEFELLGPDVISEILSAEGRQSPELPGGHDLDLRPLLTAVRDAVIFLRKTRAELDKLDPKSVEIKIAIDKAKETCEATYKGPSDKATLERYFEIIDRVASARSMPD